MYRGKTDFNEDMPEDLAEGRCGECGEYVQDMRGGRGGDFSVNMCVRRVYSVNNFQRRYYTKVITIYR
jgi:hypothetical protein